MRVLNPSVNSSASTKVCVYVKFGTVLSVVDISTGACISI